MVQFARNLAEICDQLGMKDDAKGFQQEADKLAGLINEKMWDPGGKFYFDNTFGRLHPVPTCSANEPGYDRSRGYWGGAVRAVAEVYRKTGTIWENYAPDAPRNEITWRVYSSGRSGCERFRFNNHTLTLVAEPTADQALLIRVVSDGTFHLNVIFDGIQRSYEVQTGVNSFRQ